MQEEYVCYYLHHDALACGCAQSIDYSGPKKASVGFCRRFPDRRSTCDDPEQDQSRTTAEDVRKGDDDEVRIAKREYTDTGEQTQLGLV